MTSFGLRRRAPPPPPLPLPGSPGASAPDPPRSVFHLLSRPFSVCFSLFCLEGERSGLGSAWRFQFRIFNVCREFSPAILPTRRIFPARRLVPACINSAGRFLKNRPLFALLRNRILILLGRKCPS